MYSNDIEIYKRIYEQKKNSNIYKLMIDSDREQIFVTNGSESIMI